MSYSRHEYFMRLVCDILGRDVEQGLVPDDDAMLERLVRGVCFENARDWLRMPLGVGSN